MPSSPILQRQPLDFPWPTLDPFLFCAHHDDHYPRANGRLGPAASLAGRRMGQDFSRQDGWSMYHGEEVPGFPAHPHRGFETVTLVRRGLIDHSDSLGAAARFGEGDVQWLTAGRGITHAEMFPLLHEDRDNPVELFQIWLNLPAERKMAEPHFTMFWAPDVPTLVLTDDANHEVRLGLVAGAVPGHPAPPSPPPDSWASRADADVAIWTLRLEPGACWTLPAATGAGTQRMLYFFAGTNLSVAGEPIGGHAALTLDAHQPVTLQNGHDGPAELLLLQGRPIGEPVVQYGPFVMNREAEIRQALDDYRHGGFGTWEWPRPDPVHGADSARFARYPDGRTERPTPDL
ncbi:MAG: pirin family protein [Pigmentiphaga sp.]|nr:pirin family protein [Pigmentiphaga sp.]